MTKKQIREILKIVKELAQDKLDKMRPSDRSRDYYLGMNVAVDIIAENLKIKGV